MNKILLIAIAMIAIMGTASAWPYDVALKDATGTNPAAVPLQLKPGDSITLSYYGFNIDPGAIGEDLPYYYTVEAVGGSTAGHLTVAFSNANFTPTGTTSLDVGVITVTLSNAALNGDEYLLKIGAEASGVEAGVASRKVASIPEFPTIALPIAAILGLAFIFQRRKEEE